MIAFLELLGRLLVAPAEHALSASSPAALIALAGLAGAAGLLAIATLAGMRCIDAGADASVRAHLERLVEPADRTELFSQSDPDADGHPRPRAPGGALQTA